jgi:hypothetical protein
MSASERGGLKAAFTNFKKTNDNDAELKLLGRTIERPDQTAPGDIPPTGSYQVATSSLPVASGLLPRPLMKREAVRQLSFRCPVSLATELRRKGTFNQLEQQEIIIEGIKRVLAELPDPPVGWEL